jgi:tetratricopeptide (TPR) repeat protein
LPRPIRFALAATVLATSCAGARAVPDQPAAAEVPALPEQHVSSSAIAEYVRARLAEGAGDRAAALEALRLALVHDPASPQLRIAYADALARAGKLDRAEGEARRAIELAPPGAASADAHLVLGKVLALESRRSAALQELDAAARIEAELAREQRTQDALAPIDPESWRIAARVRHEMGDEAGAAATCERLAALDPAEAAAALRELAGKLLESRNADAAERRLRRAVELAPSDPEGWKLLARMEQGRDRVGEARAAWDRALAADPDDVDALLAAGQLALHQGDLATARERLRQLLRTAPDEALAKVRVAAAWLDAKQPAEALEAASGGSDDARLPYLRGVALQQLRRWTEAAAAFAEVKPASGEIYGTARVSLGYALSRAGRGAEAVRELRRGLETLPGDPALLFALGEAFDRAGQRDAGLAQMRAVLAVKPDHAEALNFLGYAYAERGERLAEALALVERALAVEPENGYYLDSLGWVLFKQGDLARAVTTLERANAIAGPDATILEHLGDAYRSSHRPADAASAYKRALEAADLGAADPDVALASRRAGVERKLRDLGAHPRPASTRR